MEWVEYMTSDSDSALAELRRQNGREKPWKLPYFGVGNENWGCGGNMRPEYYADEYRRFANFIKSYSGNRIQKIASGANEDDYNWTEVLNVAKQGNSSRASRCISTHCRRVTGSAKARPLVSAKMSGIRRWSVRYGWMS